MNFLGLDVSTSILGWAVLDERRSVIELNHIDFSKCESFWEKVDLAEIELGKVVAKYSPSQIFIEEPMLSFKQGQSSATTISTLLRFNGLVSYFARLHGKIDPVMISVSTARKTCGMKIQRTSKCGISGKQQAFDWCVAGPLHDLEPDFPRTKTGKVKPFIFDRVDAYVICNAGVILNTSSS